jgi:hypothetical protein
MKLMSHPRTIIEQLISKLATFASTFLASDICVRFLEAVRI